MSGEEASSNLYLKNIYELLGEAFYIPAYQRGYRWTALQVKELLDDIWEFTKTEKDKSAFYCLQPIVVVRGKDDWQVVDGQQRLTTLYIILHYLEQDHLRRSFKEAYHKSLYTIGYETRSGSQDFLKNIHNEISEENIDFFHMSKAYQAVKEWFVERNYNDKNALLATLLAEPNVDKSIDANKAVKVIWYDLSEECKESDYAIDVFSRINIGKIPLTNAELVKALFLQNNRFQKSEVKLQQIQIASEWDTIEKRLQDPEFWHFIYRTNTEKDYSTRIEYIFDLMQNKKSNNETFYTFHKFSAEFKAGNSNIHDLWKSVKKYYLVFDEWFRDRELYHLIGFLVECGSDISSIKFNAENLNSKIEFKHYLTAEIIKVVKCELSELSYGDVRVKRVLLLFNILTLISSKEANARFPFDRYKQEKWDIEHIRSQTDSFNSSASRLEWLIEVDIYLKGNPIDTEVKGFLDKIEKLLEQPKMNEDTFNQLYQEIRNYFEESSEVDWVDGLGNLALLDASTNRSYKNSLFPIKRARIIENDKKGIFVPICTKNAFLKFYSNSPDKLTHWLQADAEDYQVEIAKVLNGFISISGEVNGL